MSLIALMADHIAPRQVFGAPTLAVPIEGWRVPPGRDVAA